jgi:hypothetical protein
MADVRVYVKLKYEGTTAAFYDISRRVNYESMTWEGNSEGTSANASIALWTILPKSSLSVLEYAGATESDKINAAILDESFVLEIPSKTEIRIVDVSTSPDTVLFAGYVTRVSTQRDGGAITQEIECADNTALLEELIIADFYGARDSRDIDIINGGDGISTSAASLPPIVGQVDGLQVSSEAVGGSLTDGVYKVRVQARSTTLLGRDSSAPQYSQVTSEISITLSAGTSTQRLKVKWKNASLANQHRVYVIKDSGSSYLGDTATTLLSAIDITAASRSSNVVTITTASSHGLSAGDPIIVSIPQTAGFSVTLEDYVIATATTTNTISYASVGSDGSATITGAKLTSGSSGYISSLVTAESPTTLTSSSPRGWVDGEFYVVAGNTYRLGVGDDNIRGWQYPISIFDALFDKSMITAGTLDIDTYVNAVDTQYRFSPYLPESDTANYEQYGGRSVRNVLDYISQKSGGEFWVDKGEFDGSGNYKAYLHYGAKTPKELVTNGIYDGSIDGWTTASGFTLQSATSGPYGAGYSVSSSTDSTKIETAVSSRVATSPGKKYFFSVRGKFSAHQNRWGAYIVWYDSGGTELSTTHMGNLPGAPVGVWRKVWKISQAPASAAYFGLRGQCQPHDGGSASFTDWSAVEITGAMGYGDFEDPSEYSVPIYEMEVPSSPVESGNSANRLHLYAVFRTRDADGNKVALTDESGNPVQYVDYDFIPGIWATNGKIIETAKTDDKVETLEDARLAAQGFWKENGLPIESYEFDIRPRDAYDAIYPVPEVGDIVPFIWNTMEIAKPLIVKSVKAKMLGMDVVYSITVGGDVRLQRNSFILVSERLRELDKVNPVPPTPAPPSEIHAVASIQSATVSWDFNEDLERNKNISSFEVQRQDGIFKAITNVARAATTVTITTSSAHGIVNGDKVRIEMDNDIYGQASNKIEGEWIVTATTTTTFSYTSVESGTITSVAATGWAIYNFTEFRTIQNTKANYINDNGLSYALNYRYQVRAMSTDNTASEMSDDSEVVSPIQIKGEDLSNNAITANKLVSSLKAIEIIDSATLPTVPSSSYPEGTIVYHLGGTPAGLRRVAPGGAAWENAVGTNDIVTGSITTGLISAVGIDAGVIRSGQITLDDRFGTDGPTFYIKTKQRTAYTVTLTTSDINGNLVSHGVAVDERVKILNVDGSNTGFDGVWTAISGTTGSTLKYISTVTGTVNTTTLSPYGTGNEVTDYYSITSTNFKVGQSGNVEATNAFLSTVTASGSSSKPGVLISKASNIGDLAVLNNEVLSIGHFTQSPASFDERIRMDVNGNVRVFDGYFAVGPIGTDYLLASQNAGPTMLMQVGNGSSVAGDLRVYGRAGVDGAVRIYGGASTTAGATLSFDSANSRFNMNNDLNLQGGISATTGSFTGNVTMSANVTLGNSTTDVISGTFETNASSSNTYALRWVYQGAAPSGLGVLQIYAHTSSRKYKTNILAIEDSDSILDVVPVSYQTKKDVETLGAGAPLQFGYIAEEMAENPIGSKFVNYNQDGSAEAVQYEMLAPALASAMRLLRSRIVELEQRIAELEG